MKDLFAFIGLGAVAFLGYSIYLNQQQKERELQLQNKKQFDWFNKRNQICLN